MKKAQMHFEVPIELKKQWKGFFQPLPRGQETRILTELMENFLKKVEKQYEDGKVKVDRVEDQGQSNNSEGIKIIVNGEEETGGRGNIAEGVGEKNRTP